MKLMLYLIILYLIFCISSPVVAYANEYIQIAGLIDIRSTFSDGSYSIEELVNIAKNRGLEVLIFTDHDRIEMEYGLFPFRHIIKRKIERPSVLKIGAKKYLNKIKEVGHKYPEMILIPGVESAPFYYWTGSIIKGNLTAHNWEKHILVIGLEKPEDYKNLPILSGAFSTNYISQFLPTTLLFIISALFSIFLIRWRGIYKKIGIIGFILSLLLIINYHPFKSSVFDQYHGDQGVLPYQEFIDYVNKRGGMTFWSHPESKSGIDKKGRIYVNTPPHPDDLVKTKGYTGFAAIYGDNITATEPDREWDTVLQEYCLGKRARPVWGISAADYHSEAGGKLGEFPTTFIVKEKSKEEVLYALKNGNMYVYQGSIGYRLSLDEFTVSDTSTHYKATMGEQISAKDSPVLKIKLSSSDKKNYKIQGRIIRSGKLIDTFSGTTPMKYTYRDSYFNPNEKIYYRIDVKGPGILVSNPIFVTFIGEGKGGSL
ncbi:MAG: PHP domain-containing protein [Thermodesulfobacteriota bacterium]